MKTQLLLEFAKISATTYENPNVSAAKFKDLGYSIVQFFDINGAQAYLLTNGTITVLSFRGTEVTQKSDVLADLKAGKNLEACGGKVHVGFRGEINKLWPSISAALADKPGNVYVTGHSLGAAMATIAARSECELAAEFAVVTKDVIEGAPFHIALDAMGRRIKSVTIRRFIDAMITAMLRGAPIVEVLQRHAQESRTAHRNQIMTAAGKAEISMMIPVVFLILPVSMLFALWPSLSNLNGFM